MESSTQARYRQGQWSTWEREAQRVALLAGEAGVALDEEALILCDVRELMALSVRLRRLCERQHQGRQWQRPFARGKQLEPPICAH